jgi:hypothetical protein
MPPGRLGAPWRGKGAPGSNGTGRGARRGWLSGAGGRAHLTAPATRAPPACAPAASRTARGTRGSARPLWHRCWPPRGPLRASRRDPLDQIIAGQPALGLSGGQKQRVGIARGCRLPLLPRRPRVRRASRMRRGSWYASFRRSDQHQEWYQETAGASVRRRRQREKGEPQPAPDVTATGRLAPSSSASDGPRSPTKWVR